jgi:hypothetical protein
VTRPRRRYLVIFALIAVLAAAAYLKYRAIQTARAVADCDMPAPPAKPVTPPPTLPGFAVESSCGPGGEAATPAQPKKK